MPPVYIDLQINGYAGVDFNADDLPTEAIRQACLALRRDGVAHILATVITDSLPAMRRRLRRLAEACDDDPLIGEVIAGLHIEGPFISPVEGYRGAHPAAAVQPACTETAARLLESGAGRVKLVTLAPEHDPGMRVIHWLTAAGVRVAAGHSDASLDVLRAACDAGLSVFTHLGNGCPAVLPRHDNIVQRALSLRDRLWLCFIADGVHVPFFALQNYLALTGCDRAIVVTDAMSAAGQGSGRFRLGALEIDIGDDHVARLPHTGLLAGATVTMPLAADALTNRIGLAPDQIRKLTVINPAIAAGLPHPDA